MTIVYSEQRTEDVPVRRVGILRRGKKKFECEGMETVKGLKKATLLESTGIWVKENLWASHQPRDLAFSCCS